MINQMPESTRETPVPDDPGESELLCWRSIPAHRSARTTILVVLTILGVPLVLFWWYGAFFGLLGLAILGGSLLSFFLPTDYRLTSTSIYRRYLGILQKRNWSEFRSFYPDKNGVLLSPFIQPSRLENFRGLYLRFEGNATQVLTLVKSMISPDKDAGA